ncbi:heme o synthase [Novosphingobium sp. KACC 22771]|uniref:heme o synthase n=1 Tax=Novosphingobium sp. KACC 22771 TaxID=3025670 RepID=UPI002365A776|nr:heme o synthase [Novosphingobium sp. KACC 22771]WDF72242.1 heme o synthase [Novosphingobium sp. KACC 22771]
MSIPPVKTGAKPAVRQPADWRDFFALTKPRVMTLVIFTGLCGLLAAPGHINPVIGFATILCIAVGAGGAAALNQWWEADIDAGMKRTAKRPLPAGRMDRESARDFGMALSGLSVLTMGLAAGWICAVILAVSIVYYALVYTVWLKPRTPQNIVIGGGAGAFPPMIGWVAVTGHITWMPVLLFLIIFMWTPPHFWALALFVKTDYAKVGIPMMPVVAGEKSTRRQIFAYSVLLLPLTLLPVFLPKDDGGPGWIYGVSAGVLSTLFLLLAIRVGFRNRRDEDDTMKPEKQLFAFSVLYLFALFAALVADRWAPIIGGYL